MQKEKTENKNFNKNFNKEINAEPIDKKNNQTTKWELIKKRIDNAFSKHWKILFLILAFYLLLLGITCNQTGILIQLGGNNEGGQEAMMNQMEAMNPTGKIQAKRAGGKLVKSLGSPFETGFKAMWWILSQLMSIISIILILVIVPSVPIVIYAGIVYYLIIMILSKVKTM